MLPAGSEIKIVLASTSSNLPDRLAQNSYYISLYLPQTNDHFMH
jgi:hypothetical protein